MKYELKACPYNKTKEHLLNGLNLYNLSKSNWFSQHGYAKEKKFSFCLFDDDKIIGGISGWIKASYWLYVELLYIDPTYRGNKLATALIKKAEEFALNHHLVGINLETWSFQAKGFYEKLGYSIYGKIENSPPGETEYLLKKEL